MWGYYAPYVPIDEKRDKAQKEIKKLQKENPDVAPVEITGRKIAATWWGIAWNANLEKYADYDNRLPRGRSYVKNGFVLDLQILPGKVAAMVYGSSVYKVQIDIKPLSKQKWGDLLTLCGSKVDGLDALAEGRLPPALADALTSQAGIFPSPKEISFKCSCPDGAYMCKHVAAALYGVGARLDTEPTLLFKLRGIDFEDLLKKSVRSKMQSMLKNSGNKTARTLEGADINSLFGL